MTNHSEEMKKKIRMLTSKVKSEKAEELFHITDSNRVVAYVKPSLGPSIHSFGYAAAP